ncbi:MAG TPA: DNA-directed RNA polymerase subunit D [archaeon]|nr:DNA-directed RNA polymerase subunit D [archaeon]
MEIEVLEQSEKNSRFILRGVSIPFANALRRIMISEVPSMAIDAVVIVENNSVINDETLSHRLGLIPLKTDLKTYVLPSECSCKSELGCNKCRVTLTMEAEATETTRTVYSDELKSDDPDTTPVSSKIPIAKLAPGQKIKIEAYARLGIGKQHAKWQPVAVCAYKFMPKIAFDLKKCDTCAKCVEMCPKGVLKVEGNTLTVTDILKCTLCNECVRTCPKDAIEIDWDDTTFIFNIESTGSLPVDQIVEEASNILEEKVKSFTDQISKMR